MSHNVETMAYTNEVPWHGLGHALKQAPTVEGMLKAAKIDWTVSKRPLSACFHEDRVNGKTFPVTSHFALTRDSDNRVLDVVGRSYVPTQNEEAFKFFKEFVESGRAKMETAGSLQHGRYVWGLANLNQQFLAQAGDKVRGYLLLLIPHKQGKSLLAKVTSVRVVCNNTLCAALGEGGKPTFRLIHRHEFDETMMERAKETLGLARENFGAFEAVAKKLVKMKVSDDDTIRILAPVFQPKTDLEDLVRDYENLVGPRLEAVMECLTHAPGAQPNTGWGILNAATYWADHVASRTPDKRLTNAWLGKTAAQKQRVLDALLVR